MIKLPELFVNEANCEPPSNNSTSPSASTLISPCASNVTSVNAPLSTKSNAVVPPALT